MVKSKVELVYAIIVALVLTTALITSFNQTTAVVESFLKQKTEFEKTSELIAASDQVVAGKKQAKNAEECLNRIKVENSKAKVVFAC